MACRGDTSVSDGQIRHLHDSDITPAHRSDCCVRAVSQYDAASVEELYRTSYFKVIDNNALMNMDEYFSSTDIEELKNVSNMLISGIYQADLIEKYPELKNSL